MKTATSISAFVVAVSLLKSAGGLGADPLDNDPIGHRAQLRVARNECSTFLRSESRGKPIGIRNLSFAAAMMSSSSGSTTRIGIDGSRARNS